MTTLPSLSPALEAELQQAANAGDDVLSEYNNARKARLLKKYPKPAEADLLSMFTELRPYFDTFHTRMRNDRDVRYLKDEMPEKWKSAMLDGRRVHSRLSNNEILRVRAMQTSHEPTVIIRPAKNSSPARDQAAKQTRWSKQLLSSFERQARRPIRAKAVDSQLGDGLGVYELFLTGSYDGLNLKMGENETPSAFMQRTDELIRLAGMPFGLRSVDPTAVFWDEDDDGVCAVFIAEDKPRRRVRAYLNSLKKADDIPKPGTPGWPFDDRRNSQQSITSQDLLAREGATSTVATLRYYDHLWYAYIVDGQMVELKEHGMPRLPVYLMPCIVTGSPNLSERYQGIVWGMTEMEKALNDTLTQELDSALAYGKPKPVIETPIEGRLGMEDDGKTPMVLKLDDDGVFQLEPGQKIADAYAGFKPHDTTHMQGQLQQLWQRSGMNPIAQGESPGADPAGFTVNTLQQSAQKLYQIALQNEARVWEEIVDDCRLLVRDTIRDKVVLAAPMGDSKKGETEWLALEPDDVDETPCSVTIPDDTNRLSARQSLQQANKEGFISRRRVQEEGFGIEDPEAEDDEMILDTVAREMAGVLIEQVKSAYFAAQQPPPAPAGSGLVGPNGQPISSATGVATGGIPAQPQPPTVGTGAAAASQGPMGASGGPPALSPMTAQAGQGAGSPPVMQ